MYTDTKKNVDYKTLTILLMGAYQIKYMQNIPNYAAISTSVDIAKEKLKGKDKFINAILRKFSSNTNILDVPKSIELSFPQWLYDMFLNDYGENITVKLLNELNKKPRNWIRINRNHTKVINTLTENNIKYNIFTIII